MEEILALRIFHGIVGIIGLLGNGLVCLVIWRVSALHTRTNAFIFHQAVVDFLGSALILLHSELPEPNYPLPDNALGWVLCKIWFSHGVQFTVFVTSTFNLLAVTMERYFAIVYPFKYQAAFSRHPRLKVGLAIAMCWLIGIAFIYSAVSIFDIRDGRSVPVPSSQAVGVLTIFVQYLMPVAVMLFAYIHTSVELKRGAARVGPSSGQATGMAESLLRARDNTFKNLLIVFVTFTICWTPNELVFLMFNLGYPIVLNSWYHLITVAMVAANSCVNPVIYAFKYRQFRQGMREMFCGKTSHTSEVASVT